MNFDYYFAEAILVLNFGVTQCFQLLCPIFLIFKVGLLVSTNHDAGMCYSSFRSLPVEYMLEIHFLKVYISPCIFSH